MPKKEALHSHPDDDKPSHEHVAPAPDSPDVTGYNQFEPNPVADHPHLAAKKAEPHITQGDTYKEQRSFEKPSEQREAEASTIEELVEVRAPGGGSVSHEGIEYKPDGSGNIKVPLRVVQHLESVTHTAPYQGAATIKIQFEPSDKDKAEADKRERDAAHEKARHGVTPEGQAEARINLQHQEQKDEAKEARQSAHQAEKDQAKRDAEQHRRFGRDR